MSYAFSKCLAAQTAFETTEELFIRFLDSLITSIITPFSSQFGKFNITSVEQSNLSALLNIIRELYSFHIGSQKDLRLSSNSEPYQQHHGHTRNRHLQPISPMTPTSPSIGTTASLHCTIFKCYSSYPMIYRKYFDIVMPSLSCLSTIITRSRNVTKWFRSRYDDVQHIANNGTTYKSFAEILSGILQHGYSQSNRLQEIANSKYWKKDNDARTWKENMRRHLENAFIKKWDKTFKAKFELLDIELCITGHANNNVQIYQDERRLMYRFDVQIPTKALSKKNLWGLNKKTNQTQDGLLYIFNDMMLICSKEHNKFKGCFNFNETKQWSMVKNDDEKSITFTDHTKNKKVSVFMSKVEECRAAFDTIQQTKHILQHIIYAQNNKRSKRSTFSSEEYIVQNLNDLDPQTQPTHAHPQPISVPSLHQKSPPIPITQHISSPTSPNGYFKKSSSYQSQSQSASQLSQSQLEANTKYNRGSMQSRSTYSILTENTSVLIDLSEPRISNAFSVQQTPVTTHIHDADTPLIQSDTEQESTEMKPVAKETQVENVESEKEKEKEQEEKVEQRRQKFDTFRSTSIQHGRRFSVPSMLSSIASSGNETDHNDADNNNEGSEAVPIIRSKSFGTTLDACDNSKQVRFKNNNSNNSINGNIVINLSDEALAAAIDVDSDNALFDNVPIYDEEEMILKDEIENLEEEQYVIEEHRDKEKERDEIENIDLNKEEETSSIEFEAEEDPHGVLNVDMNGYTSEDDREFKRKLLLQPKWAKNGLREEAFCVREYPLVSKEQYGAVHREVLNPVTYGANMHLHQLKQVQKVKDMKGISKRKKDEIIVQKQKELQKIERHPFQRFLDEMHAYEEKGSEDEIKNNNNNLSVQISKKKKKHSRIQSRELYYFDDDDEEIVEETTHALNPLNDEEATKPHMMAQISGASNNLSISIHDGHESRNISLSTLGPSPSMVFGKSFGDNNDAYDDDNNAYDDNITQTLLDRLNLQTNNRMLMAEIQRLRHIITEQSEDMDRLERDNEILAESLTDKDEQIKSVRSTNNVLKSRLEDVGDELHESHKQITQLKGDNERLRNIIREYPLMDVDDAEDDTSSSRATSARPTPTTQVPLMSWSKSDVNHCAAAHNQIAPDLLKDAQNQQRFIQSSRNLSPVTKTKQHKKQKLKNKTKTFRKKYHSFALGQAKKERMQRLRDRNNNNNNNNETEAAIDHLGAVKNRLIGLKLGGVNSLMPQSITNMTPQASQRSTPRNAMMKTMSNKSLLSTTSDATPKLNNCNDLAFGSPIGCISPKSPQTSSFPSCPAPAFAAAPHPLLAVSQDSVTRTKSYDNIHKIEVSKSSHTRKDTPTPNSSNKKISFIYNLDSVNNKRSESSNNLDTVNNHKTLEFIPSMPTSANSSGSSLLPNGRRRISFAEHTRKMRYVCDDDQSDTSITMTANQRKNGLKKQAIAYTKSANTLLTQTQNVQTLEKEVSLPDYSHQSYKSLLHQNNNNNNNNNEIPSYFSRSHSKSFTAQKPRQRMRRSGSQTIRSSTHNKSMQLKDRTRACSGAHSNSRQNIVRRMPQTPGPRSAPKRRSVNWTQQPRYSLKPSQRAKHQLYISKSPSFIPQHHTPSSYPATFNTFTLSGDR